MAKRHIDQFRGWLRKQTAREDRIGDFARDFLLDDCAEDVPTLSSLDRHLIDDHNAPDKVLVARDYAWREFVASGAFTDAAPAQPHEGET